jgi:polyphosphate glucokinase
MLAAMPSTAARFRDDPPAPPPGTRLSGVALGIDVGGTGVKAGLVDLATAELVTDRIREKTPQPSKPEAVAATIGSVVSRVLAEHPDIPADLPVGCGLPGVVKDGRLTTAANIDHEWVGWPAEEGIGAVIGRRVLIVNDADAAGLAEVAYGAGEGAAGTLLLLTIGTGIGSAVFIDGILVPNTEFGHIELKGRDAESRVSGASRERRGIGWKAWAREFDLYLSHLELYLQPDLIILGGGVSKEMAKFGKYLEASAPIVTARYLNTSGIIGAAYAAAFAQRIEKAGSTASATKRRRLAKGDPGTYGELPGKGATAPRRGRAAAVKAEAAAEVTEARAAVDAGAVAEPEATAEVASDGADLPRPEAAAGGTERRAAGDAAEPEAAAAVAKPPEG